MFDLELAILEWRRRMLAAGIKDPNVLDELESHLREDVARQIGSGEPGEKAFETALRRVGDPRLLRCEFAKAGGKTWLLLRWLKGVIFGSFVPFPSLDTFTPGARQALELARMEAPRLHHNFVGTEHVLLGLLALEDGVVPNVLNRLGVDREEVRKQIENWVSIFPPQKMRERLPFTPRVKRSLRLVAREAEGFGHASVGAEHVFLGLVLERDGVAGRVLRNLGITSEVTRREIIKGLSRP